MRYFLRCDCSVGKADWLYLIPTIKVICTKYLEIEIAILAFVIYWVISIEDYDKDES